MKPDADFAECRKVGRPITPERDMAAPAADDTALHLPFRGSRRR